ncbi:hypothetical protein TNIN_368611 [Trichonephila inaurata madagascariensis]|uniref:C2H2-type domain-containing protein n=1 Tax=Trichonephila inaurata madagascariensis TaxID=2747483 RepID=A0A8X6YRX9_9ARAC|nr:hypothetical protein TNIN_368611 [Trichonephila inaurata madagascariensis]
MAEANINPSEEFLYFCGSCRNASEETKKIFTFDFHQGPGFICTRCGGKFNHGFITKKITQCGVVFEAGYKREQIISSDNTTHRCPECGKTFRRSFQLLHHSYNYSDDWPHRCPVCQQGFAVRSLLELHERKRNTVRKIRCSKCLNYFRGKICLKILHLPTIDFFCKKCSNGPSLVEYVAS